MKPQIKKLWVAALRSGDYIQTDNQLRTHDNKFCCFGVLCNLHAIAHPKIAKKQTDNQSYMGAVGLPGRSVLAWAGLHSVEELVSINDEWWSLYRHNDNGATFLQIADAIEFQL